MTETVTAKKNERALIAAMLYVFVSIGAGAWTFMRQFEGVGCGSTLTCDGAMMHFAIQPYLWVNVTLLAVVVPVCILLAAVRRPTVRVPTAALIGIGVYSIAANVAYSMAMTPATG